MDIEVDFPGGKRVVAQVGSHRIETDQPAELGGQDASPAPFDLFLASLATCAGIYALGFLQARGLPTAGMRLRQHVDMDPASHLPTRVRLELTLPPGVPEKYRSAVLRAVENCKVKKTIAAAPVFEGVLQPEVEAAHV
jgi:ribosomal protein S12 methylthiotransferase accessory factor